MRLLVISPQPFFSPRGTPLSVYYRTLITADMIPNIDLLTYGQGQDVDIPGVKLIRIPHFAFLGDVKIGPSLLKLFLDFFLFVWTIGLLIRNRYDAIHAHEEAIFFCLPLKFIFQTKLLYDMHSSLPQQLTNFQFTTSQWLINIFKWLEDKSLKHADGIITICPDLANYVTKLIGKNGKHVLIENSIFEPVRLTKTFSNGFANKITPKLEKAIDEIKPNTPLIVYAGTLEPYQGIDILLHAYQTVLSHLPAARLLIIGGTPGQVKNYKSLSRKLDINHTVIFTGNVPQQVARQWCRRAHLLVSPRKSGTNTPLKIYEQLASGIPLLATNIYSHTQAIDDKVAFLVAPNAAAMAKGILESLTNRKKRLRKSRAAKELYAEKYARDAYEKKLRQIMRTALGAEFSLIPRDSSN